MSLLICPNCRAPLPDSLPEGDGKYGCASCRFEIPLIEGVPLLVRDRAALEAAIDEARRSERAQWYEAPQAGQWQGPYRHHLRKRRAYVDRVVREFVAGADAPLVGLDAGCGDGGHIPWLAQYVTTLYASDYNAIRLTRAARAACADHLFVADLTDYPVRDDGFDIIFFNHVLEHIKDDLSALREIHRALKPGGLLILGVPNEGAFFWQLAYRLQSSTLEQTDHVQFYTAKSLSRKCLTAGFRIAEVKPIGWGVPYWWLDSMIRGYKWIDDLFEAVGARLFPSQATSLYLILSK